MIFFNSKKKQTMEALELYKFIEDKDIPLRWDDDQLSCWIPSSHLDEFCELAPDSFFDNGGAEAVLLRDATIWMDLVPLCEYCGIDPMKIKIKE